MSRGPGAKEVCDYSSHMPCGNMYYNYRAVCPVDRVPRKCVTTAAICPVVICITTIDLCVLWTGCQGSVWLLQPYVLWPQLPTADVWGSCNHRAILWTGLLTGTGTIVTRHFLNFYWLKDISEIASDIYYGLHIYSVKSRVHTAYLLSRPLVMCSVVVCGCSCTGRGGRSGCQRGEWAPSSTGWPARRSPATRLPWQWWCPGTAQIPPWKHDQHVLVQSLILSMLWNID